MVVVGTQTMLESISFRPLSRSDFPLFQRWLLEPHVVAWWHESLDLAGIEAKYGPRIDGTERTHVCVIEYRKRPVGWIQWYRWSDYPEHALQLGAGPESAGIDLAIGEQEMMGMGLGPAAIRKFINQTIFVDPTIRAVIADPAESNLRSLRAFKKAGFSVTKTVELLGESFQRSVVRLSRPR
jgi:aminoglycoside 6'-N-acetyltransferase